MMMMMMMNPSLIFVITECLRNKYHIRNNIKICKLNFTLLLHKMAKSTFRGTMLLPYMFHPDEKYLDGPNPHIFIAASTT